VALYVFLYAVLLLATFAHRLGFTPRALVLLGVVYVYAVTGFALLGVASSGPVFLFGAVALAAVLFELRWSVGVLLLCVATVGGMGAGFALSWLGAPPVMIAGTPASWFGKAALLLGFGTATVISMTFLIRRLESSVETSADLVRSLRQRYLERVRVQEALRVSETRLLEAQRVARIGSFEWDVRERSIWWSDELYRVFGREIGADWPRFRVLLEEIHAEDRVRVAAGVRAWLSGEGPSSLECRMVWRDGSIRHLRGRVRLELGADGQPERLLGTIQDITEARELEQQLRQSQKLEALGQLAGGIAHDFNNLLTVISGYGGGLVAELRGEAQEAAKEVSAASQRASALTRQLLAFGRRPQSA
jgi:PAS domain-containing protein